VNNAGVYAPATPTWEISPAWWDEVIETNLRGVFLCCRAAIPHLIEGGGGSIVNVTSLAAAYEFPVGIVDLAYSTSKQAVDRFTASLSQELAPFDIAVNGLSPVQIRTPGTRAGWGEGFDDSEYSDPSAIGAVTVFLAQQRRQFSGHIVRRDEFVDGAYRQLKTVDVQHRFPSSPDKVTASQRAAAR
jgi:NAD(P)-dependent dehydrogenase (short-subunit alcohol dehydrogenase family)